MNYLVLKDYFQTWEHYFTRKGHVPKLHAMNSNFVKYICKFVYDTYVNHINTEKIEPKILTVDCFNMGNCYFHFYIFQFSKLYNEYMLLFLKNRLFFHIQISSFQIFKNLWAFSSKQGQSSEIYSRLVSFINLY